MMAANNHKAIAHIARRSLKANLPRNLIIISAIVLTTLLFTSVFTMAFSLNESMQLTKIKTVGGDFHGSFKYLKPDEADRLLQHPSIKEYGKAVLVGRAIGDEFRATPLELNHIDENEAKHSFVKFEQGGLPAEEDGIAMSTWVLDLLGVPYELGAKVKLSLDIDGQTVTKEFVLTGYYPSDRNLSMAGLAFVSEAFVQRNISHIAPERSRLSGSYVNTMRLDVMLANSFGIEKKLQKVLSDTGLDVPYGVNWAYSSVALEEDPANAVPYIVLILIIMLSGYLLIYNIFHISVVRDIKFYGLLKTIGTTPSQLRRIISIQANRLYVTALPAGLVLGYGVGLWLMPQMSRFSDREMDIAYSINPLIFVGGAVFAYLTVRIAASKPGRTAARITPVEAVKFSGIGGSPSRKIKRSTQGAKLFRMSLGNLFRYKKKLLLMLASLSLSIILFSVIYTVISSFSVNKYLNSYISGDIVVKEDVGGRSGVLEPDAPALSKAVIRSLSQINGVTSLDKVYYSGEMHKINEPIQRMLEPLAAGEDPNQPVFTSLLKNGTVPLQFHGISSGWYHVIDKNAIVAGTFDQDKFDSGNYVLISEALLHSDQHASYYQPGDRIKLGGMKKSYEVMAVMKSDALYAAGTQVYMSGGFNAFWPADEFVKSVQDPVILSATLHVDPAKLGEVEAAVKSIVASSPSLITKSREDYKQEMEGFIRIFQTIGYGLSFVIALIGVLNYINTVITGMLSRRNEFAILESVGMTRKQLEKMLVLEAIYSVLLITLIVGTAGIGLTYLVAKGVTDNIAFTEFRMNPLPISGVVPLLVVIALTMTLESYRRMSKTTIVERMREAK